MDPDKFKKKRQIKPMATRAINYTATMPQEDLEALDAIDGSRSSKILTAVKSYYKI